MIIVDLNQIMISNLMVQLNGRNAEALSEDHLDFRRRQDRSS